MDKDYNVIWTDKKRIFGMPISFTRYILDETRLIIRSGLFNQTEEEILLYRIVDINLHISLIDRIFGVGNITLYSSDASTPEFTIRKVKSPRKVKEALSQNIYDQRKLMGIPVREMIGLGFTSNGFDVNH